MAPKNNAKMNDVASTNSSNKRKQPLDTTSKSLPSKQPKTENTESSPTDISTKSNSDPSNKSPSQTINSTHTTCLKVVESKGDIFSAPPNTLLIHACNCEGSWGAGIAKAFKTHYPSAYEIYHDHCTSHTPEELIGTALLIPTSHGGDDDDDDNSTQTRTTSNRKTNTTTAGNKQPNPSEQQRKHQHFIGCLFTSRSKGAKKRDSPSQILDATGSAMRGLLEQVAKQEFNSKSTVGEDSSSTPTNHDEEDNEGKKKKKGQKAQGAQVVEEIRMCKINSGLFNVPWEKTKAVIEGIEVPGVTTESHGKSKAEIREIRCISRE
ncbi:hypothetical protein KC318_g12088 [Hortaea werneckii]|nr:hypothetical protein KC334_g6053 [Hortaea werneckii]KAI7003651.1 hypothetical protein KC355_g9105 [Hortaea werneckii]KAI7139293.1 hypothetical protein KC324_g16431 [Hortaea werneckii]KAI7553267.1 hypothetical protein KC316_g13998 [Hortaea werneckii]KAI7656952.1 hypothetical protein KC318_g12088 [Hortaea werneckii]